MKFKKIMKKIQEANKFPIGKKMSDEESDFLQLFWISIRDNNKEIINKIEEDFNNNGKTELFDSILEEAKKRNQEYYDFEYFRNENIDDIKKEFLLNSIFKEYILIDKRNLDKFVDKDISMECLISISSCIESIIFFCVANNFDGYKVVEILVEHYKIKESLLLQYQSLYEENILMLKLNFIIRNISIM